MTSKSAFEISSDQKVHLVSAANKIGKFSWPDQGCTRGVKGGCYALVFALCTLAHIAEQFVEVVMCCTLSIDQFKYKSH